MWRNGKEEVRVIARCDQAITVCSLTDGKAIGRNGSASSNNGAFSFASYSSFVRHIPRRTGDESVVWT
ncbi:hypothetical protein [Actinomadura macra]|uniref:hypothetical protein n=1 Tax=Actinomadura macra TaxID=46164 RepID=UPI000AA7AD7C|nr:hypothetical protein [Actinomadura macra]